MTRRAVPIAGRLIALLAGLVLASGCALAPAASRLRDAIAPQVFSAGAVTEPMATPLSRAAGDALVAAELRPRPRKGAFAMDLYDRGDHVPQFDKSWCVGASMQMMANMIEGGRPDRTRQTQRQLYDLARDVSPWIERRPGASTYGWAGGLTQLGYGPYGELSATGRAQALRIAARQMRYTGKPVGLLVWRGRHAWVMSGFRASADPAYTDDFEVTAVWIEDPWAGRVSTIWGPGLRPHTLVATERLTGFTRWSSRFRPELGARGRYVMVAPMLEGTADGLAPVAGAVAPVAGAVATAA
jgi:hypothetical protein